MEVLHPRCAGLDVHQDSVVACVRVVQGGEVRQEVRTFEATTQGLFTLSDWLSQEGCTHVVMEATGVYWAAVHTKNSYERALFFRLKSPGRSLRRRLRSRASAGRAGADSRGPHKAIIAVAASMLTAIYHILKERLPYVDLGPDHFDKVDVQRRTERLVHRLQRLGYEVELRPVA